jgi:class 3 adenylate cyclase
VVQTLESGRKAVQHQAWTEAWETLTEVDHEEKLSPQDLELLADAAWWSGHPDESEEALERAFNGYVDASMPAEAATVATLLAYLASRRLSFAIAGGWRAKAARLLEGQPESRPHAFLKVLEVIETLIDMSDFDKGIPLADETIELARRTGNRDAESLVLAFKGYALVSRGMWQEGLALIDEATATALSGESLRAASDVYCVTIATCRNVGDFQRAGEWTQVADRWMSRYSLGGYAGVCKVHRAELKRLHGDWGAAEQEAINACEELERYHILDGVGMAHYEIGEVRLHMGDLSGAQDSFDKAYEFGTEPQPGLALLKLATGKVDEAAQALSRALDDGGEGNLKVDLLTRARLLPAQVEVALARDDLETARKAVDELQRLAAEYQRPAFEATALTAAGQVSLLEGDAAGAGAVLDRAWRAWKEIDFPYESAVARTWLGRAHLAAGDPARGRMELAAARTTFERLGAKPDLRRVDDLLYALDRPLGDRTRVTKTFMFTDIVTSTDLVGLIGDDAWESLLAWHDRELRATFAAQGGVEVSHTGDGFFVSFDRSTDAVEAGVAIQRLLGEHRRKHGFSPSVRIGIHTAEATVDGSDYRGQGVHLAARVGAAAGAEEILISQAALDDVSGIRFPVSEARSIDLKGIKDPVEVRSVEWR